MACATIARRLRAIVHAIISDDGSDTKPVIGEHIAPPGSLGATMFLDIEPGRDSLIIPKERQREDLVRLGSDSRTARLR
jgi:hypothetical protein